jgi:tetratricopeptide (TPR) repeat protein
MELAPGARLGPYEVLEPLGAGGMGQVWKARDPRLGRDVAVKIIAHARAEDAGLQLRFEREARALSALNHPNIVCVFDVGEQNGSQYIISELVPGESLRQRISRGPLPSGELLRMASQISNALMAAHAAGIVHRDLKPENIMITPDGRPKILDFGLARRIPERTAAGDSTVTQTTATQPGTVMGTAGYMSPEQICGEEVDGRSDIFSMGVVLYEMATGARAFQGRSSIEMMSAILKDDPPHLPAKVHQGLDQIIRRCLQKSPAKRFQDAAGLHAALEALLARTAVGRTNRGTWLALSAVAGVALVGGTAYWQSSKKAAPVPVTAVRGAEVPQAAVSAPPPVQTAPAPPDTPNKPAPPKTGPTGSANEAAYQQAYEQGMLLLSQRNWAEAAARLTEAIRLRPNSALPRLGLCRAAAGQQDNEKAVSACTEAIRLAPNSADAYHDRGTAYLLSRKYDQAVADMNAAIHLGDTNPALAHSVRGRAHSSLKEWGPAIEDFDEAIRLNPKNPHFHVFRGMAYMARHQNRKAIDDFDEALRLQPNLPLAYGQRALARQRMGDTAGAEADRSQAKGLRK